MSSSYPIFLNLFNKKCIVVGGGRVAQRKVEGLLDTGAQIVVISPDLRNELQELASKKKLRWEERNFKVNDLEGAHLVFAATNDPKKNKGIAKKAAGKNYWVNVANGARDGDFWVPSIVRRGQLSLAVSTDGASPALSKRLRLELEHVYGPEYEEFIEFLTGWRKKIKKEIKAQEKREKIFKSIIASDCLNFIRESRLDEAEDRVKQIIQEYGK